MYPSPLPQLSPLVTVSLFSISVSLFYFANKFIHIIFLDSTNKWFFVFCPKVSLFQANYVLTNRKGIKPPQPLESIHSTNICECLCVSGTVLDAEVKAVGMRWISVCSCDASFQYRRRTVHRNVLQMGFGSALGSWKYDWEFQFYHSALMFLTSSWSIWGG